MHAKVYEYRSSWEIFWKTIKRFLMINICFCSLIPKYKSNDVKQTFSYICWSKHRIELQIPLRAQMVANFVNSRRKKFVRNLLTKQITNDKFSSVCYRIVDEIGSLWCFLFYQKMCTLFQKIQFCVCFLKMFRPLKG